MGVSTGNDLGGGTSNDAALRLGRLGVFVGSVGRVDRA